MYEFITNKLHSQTTPIDLIVVGLGFMGFGFISYLKHIQGIRVSVLITRRVNDSARLLTQKGFKVKIVSGKNQINKYANKNFICISDNLNIINSYKNKIVLEMTGSIGYGCEVALRAINSGKDLVTMNVELQATVGSKLLSIANKEGVLITDTIGDQPGSLARMIYESRLMGFEVLIAGNIKRYLDKHATNKKMAPWAKDKGLNVTQTTSFTDGTKQALEMSLVANYFQMGLMKNMAGPSVKEIKDTLNSFNLNNIPRKGIVDYIVGKNLFPGIFLVVKHKDKNQQKYLRYLSLGEGPYYVLFEPYHLCHLEILETILGVLFFKSVTINNSTRPKVQTIAIAKSNLPKNKILSGIGGDDVYGQIALISKTGNYLPVGLAENARLKRDLKQDEPIKKIDIDVEDNAATRLFGLINPD